MFPAKHSGEKDVIEFSTSPLNQFYEPFSRFHRQIEDTDVSVFSYPWGNSKFGIFDFDTSNETKLDLSFRLIVDGDLTWSYSWTYTRGSVLDGI